VEKTKLLVNCLIEESETHYERAQGGRHTRRKSQQRFPNEERERERVKEEGKMKMSRVRT